MNLQSNLQMRLCPKDGGDHPPPGPPREALEKTRKEEKESNGGVSLNSRQKAASDNKAVRVLSWTFGDHKVPCMPIFVLVQHPPLGSGPDTTSRIWQSAPTKSIGGENKKATQIVVSRMSDLGAKSTKELVVHNGRKNAAPAVLSDAPHSRVCSILR